jgi:hypothetical protein
MKVKSNEDILDLLQKDLEYKAEYEISLLNQWDKNKSDFPIDRLTELVRFDKWKYSDFNFMNEQFITEFFPQFVLDIFFAVKEFKKNSRNELLHDQELFAQLYNMPVGSQEEKAKVVYEFSFQRYFENSNIVMKENV